MASNRYEIRIIKANNLGPRNASSSVDPYVKLRLGREPKRKTRILGQTLNPKWDEKFVFADWHPTDVLVVSVWNCKAITKNEFLGMLTFSYPDDETGHQKITQPLLPDATKTVVQGSLTLEIINHAQKKKWEKANPVTSEPVKGPSEEAGLKALNKMKKGEYFDLLYGDNLYLVNLYWMDNGNMGTLHWVQSVSNDMASVPPGVPQKIAVNTICDIFVGVPSPHSRHKHCKNNPERCLSIADKKKNRFDLVSKSEDQTDLWLEGMKYLLTSRGKKVVQNKQAVGGGDKATPASKKGRRLTVEGSAPKDKKDAAATFKGQITEQVSLLLQGFDVVQYLPPNDAPTKNDQFVFFSKKGGKFGSLHWCDRNDRDENDDSCIYLHRISQLCVGKQRKIFQNASEVEDELCVSIIAKEREFHMVVGSVHVMKSLVIGLEHILCSNGRTVVLDSKNDGADKNRRFSRQFSVAVRSKSSHPGVLKMAKGAHFTRFRQKKSRADRSVKTQVFVFHSSLVDKKSGKPVDSAGALFWYEQKEKGESEDAKKKSDRHIIPIQSISDIYCEKQHEIFQTKCASDAKDECAFSIKGMETGKDGNPKEFILHLEADSPEVVDEWMDGIAHLLKQGGREIQELDEGKAESDAPAAGKKMKRMSVAPPTMTPRRISDDPFDMLGVAVMPAAVENDLQNFFPSERPHNPFFVEPEPVAAVDNHDPFFGMEDTQQINEETWDPFANVDMTPEVPRSVPAQVDNPFADIMGGVDSSLGLDFMDATPAPPAKEAPAPAAAAAGGDGGGGDELARFLASIQLNAEYPKFKTEDIDLEALRELEKSDYADLSVSVGARVKIMKALKNWP